MKVEVSVCTRIRSYSICLCLDFADRQGPQQLLFRPLRQESQALANKILLLRRQPPRFGLICSVFAALGGKSPRFRQLARRKHYFTPGRLPIDAKAETRTGEGLIVSHAAVPGLRLELPTQAHGDVTVSAQQFKANVAFVDPEVVV